MREVSVSESGHRRLLGLVSELDRQSGFEVLELIANPLPSLTGTSWSPTTRIVSPEFRTRAVHHPFLGHFRRLFWGKSQVMHFLAGDVWSVPTCKTVVSLTGVAPLRHAKIFFASRQEELAYRDHLETVFRVADRVIVPTETACKEISLHHPQYHGKLVVIRNGLDPVFIPEEWGTEDRSRFRLNIGSKRGFLLHTGGVNILSGLDFLLEAYRVYCQRSPAPRKLVVTGDPHRPHKGIPTLYEMAAQRGLLSDVILVGDVSDEFLRRLYSSAALVVHPSRGGSYGFAPLEAMACGCPVLSSDAGALPELLGDAALLTPAEDIHTWAGKMVELTEDTHLRAELIGKGMEHVKQFSWKDTAHRIVEVYQQVIDSG